MREHCLRMISHLNALEVLGADIDGESQADMILQSLLESFKEFILNYNMNKMIYTLPELMNELVATEGILGIASVIANMLEASTSQPKSKGKGKKKKKKDFTKKDGKQIVLGELPTRERRRTTPKEGVSIVTRKVIGRGIVQN